jgi:ribosome-associated protein
VTWRRGNEKEVQIVDRPSETTTPERVLGLVNDALEDGKAEEIVVVSLAGKSTLGDYMVIATGRSNRQVAAMAEHVIRRLKEIGIKGVRPEGLRQRDWVLIDAGDVIVHLFRPEVRSFYNLEKMWGAELPEPDRSAGAAYV